MVREATKGRRGNLARIRQLQSGGRLSVPREMLRSVGISTGDSILIELDPKDPMSTVIISKWEGRSRETE